MGERSIMTITTPSHSSNPQAMRPDQDAGQLTDFGRPSAAQRSAALRWRFGRERVGGWGLQHVMNKYDINS